ncbi:MAG TPA: CRISPR-associated endonuclease Cas2 [Acholeplasmataceae bacterium]|nr:CRISPR-associated endonuclease Cas2 [Acholeplasmataceae bacterium]
MRVMVLYDLPMGTSSEIRVYTKFRKFLIKSGFMMMQESVYTKLALNQTVCKNIMDNVKKNKPNAGLVQMLAITEKQYSKMEIIVGQIKSTVLSTDERLVIL